MGIEELNSNFSLNLSMLYPKHIMTYSAYVKNMEMFVKNSLGLKKDIKIEH